ncbi:MAG TPA: hypothetical protein VF317_08445 [Dermatophilaceae bacterium]
MNAIFITASGTQNPPTLASTYGWVALGSVLGAVLVGGGRALYCRRWGSGHHHYDHAGGWTFWGSLAGAFVGLAVGILWWASHVHHEMGRGLGVFLVLAGGIILYAWATPRR